MNATWRIYEEERNLSWIAIAIVCRNQVDIIVAMVVEGVGLDIECLSMIHVESLGSSDSSICMLTKGGPNKYSCTTGSMPLKGIRSFCSHTHRYAYICIYIYIHIYGV